ncbi:ankyrin repeat domain protein [Nitzschia inconspicua]|uniref:Ankyrin repeat domain protein n=1 Tax=Nitzschia inconspicua TaxID=303405 RepID=A0A9K3L8T3_9STRA|nr:ankyrin repeat domain protein [Nitzschia inconspicua]
MERRRSRTPGKRRFLNTAVSRTDVASNERLVASKISIENRRSMSPSSKRESSSKSSTEHNYVWVRTEIVEAIWSNHGTLPKEWKPKRKRGRNDSWGWTRAYVVQSSTNAVSHTSTDRRSVTSLSYRLKATDTKYSTLLATLTVDDDEFAPPHLKGATVSLSFNPNDTETVCNANGWWMQPETCNNPPHDLTSLTHLHEPAVVYCLKRRFHQHSIYTYTGKVLLALNPFQPLEGVYGEDIMKRYGVNGPQKQANSTVSPTPPPHAYAVAQDAYHALMEQGDNQSILVSGESGSGKTVTVKVIMSYLANQSRRSLHPSTPQCNDAGHHHTWDYGVLADGDGIEAQILSSNPILESFGNARTVRNDNSSRFGKFLQLYFTPSAGALVSASVETYLLEKVRIVMQTSGERNYHIFYELLAGLSQEERKLLRIENETPQDFRMTASSGTFHRRDGVDDRDSFKSLQQAMDTLEVASAVQRDLFTVVCALLHLSNVSFAMKDSTEECELVASQSLEDALHLLGVSQLAINNAFCTCAIEARGEVFHKTLTVAQGQKAHEAFIKATYEALFKFIVALINQSINSYVGTAISRDQLPRIGILDIFGFECFDTNSFEQLCINYCNEALQQQFNRFMFKLEQQEYDEEGIDWSFIEFPDNEDVLALIENRRDGIFEILDENCRLSSCTDSSFVRSVLERCENHPRFGSSQIQRANQTFTIEHYLGTVAYCCEGFLEKNKDDLPKQSTDLLLSSTRSFMLHLGGWLVGGGKINHRSTLISSVETSRSPTGQDRLLPTRNSVSSILRETVSSQFRIQLHELRIRIDSTTPHFVRCLKPNEDLTPNKFNASMIADQLRCAGVLEAIRVSRIGFPHRFYHEQFLGRYGILANQNLLHGEGGRKHCTSLITSLIPKVSTELNRMDDSPEEASSKMVSQGMQVGVCRVFMRAKIFRALESLRTEKLGKAAILIQKHLRRFQASMDFRLAQEAVGVIQCFVRKIRIERNVRLRRRNFAASKIQASWRRFFAETELMAAKLIALFCQAYWRGMIARRCYRGWIFERRVITLQGCWRKWKGVREYRRTLDALLRIQCFLRCCAAKRVFKERKRAVRTLDFISEDRNRYREEANRLREEVERLRSLNDATFCNKQDDEMARLRAEVSRLHELLSMNHFHTTDESTSQPLPKATVIHSPDLIKPRHTCKNEWSNGPGRGQAEWSPPAAVSLSDAASSPNISLLDMDRDHEVALFSQGLTDRVILLDDGSVMVSESPLNHAGKQRQRIPSCTLSLVSEEEERRHRMEKVPFPENECELTQFHWSIQTKNQPLMADIISQCQDPLVLVNHPNPEGKTALHVAAECDNISAAVQALELGAVANVQDHLGNTALHLAKGEEMVKILLGKGSANPNIPNSDGKSALHVHVERLDTEAVSLLLKKGAKADAADHTNWFTPLHLAVMSSSSSNRLSLYPNNELNRGKHRMMVDLLCNDESTIDLNYQDCHGNTPLHYAVQEATPDAADIISIVLGKGADPNLPNLRNQQALLLLCHNNELRKLGVFHQCLQTLLNYGADTSSQSKTGCTPLHLCLYHYDIDSAVLLLHYAAELHLVWKKPKSWESHWEDNGSSDVLPLDMVSDDQSLYRILAAIKTPGKLAPSRPWCMQCKSLLKAPTSHGTHCGHCGRHLCIDCIWGSLPPDYFPPSFKVSIPMDVCNVCKDILLPRDLR